MLNNLTSKVVLAAAGVLFATASTAAPLGNGSDHAILKYMNFEAVGANTPIHVISTNRKKWNAIKPGTLKLFGSMEIKAKGHGKIIGVGVALGQCGPGTCSPGAMMFSKNTTQVKSWSGSAHMQISTEKIPVSNGGGIPTIPYGDQIIAACNEHLSANGPTKEYRFNRAFQATFLANSRRKKRRHLDTSGIGGTAGYAAHIASVAPHAVSDNFTVTIVCEPVEPETAEDVPDDPEYAVNGVKLFLSTFSDAKTNPAAGVECEKGRILARLTTTKEGPVKFRVYTQLGDGPIEKEFVEAWSSKKGSEFKAEFKKWISVTKSTSLKAMIQDLTNPIGGTSGWKDLPLHCSAPGGGGWAPPPKPNVGDGATPQAESPSKPPKVIVTPRPQAKPPVTVTPKPRRPAKPTIKVAPKPKLVCINGRVSRNTCFCPARTVKKRIGAAAYRCDRAVAKPKRVIPKAPPVRLRPKVLPKRIITRAPPKRSTPKRVVPKRKAAPKIGTRTRRAR